MMRNHVEKSIRFRHGIWGMVAFMFFVIANHCLAANEEIGLRWFFKIGDHICQKKVAGNDTRYEIIEYHKLLLEMGQNRRAYNIFQLKNRIQEKIKFFEFLWNVYDVALPMEEELRIVYKTFRKIDSYSDDVIQHFPWIAAALDAGHVELAKEMVTFAEKLKLESQYQYSGDEGYFKAEYLVTFRDFYRLLGYDKKAEKKDKELQEFIDSCKSENVRDSECGCECDCNPDYVFIAVTFSCINYGDPNNALPFMEVKAQEIFEHPLSLEEGDLLFLTLTYLELGDEMEARMLAAEMIERITQEGEATSFLKEGNKFIQYRYDVPPDEFYEVVDYGQLEDAWQRAMKLKFPKLAYYFTRLMFGAALYQKDLPFAEELLNIIAKRFKDHCKDIEYYRYLLIGNRIWHDSEFDYEADVPSFEKPYYNLDLNYEYAWYLYRQMNFDKAKLYMNKCFERYNQPGCISLLEELNVRKDSIVDFFWRLEDVDGLKRVISNQKGEHEIEDFEWLRYSYELAQRRLIDVYLINDQLDRAEKFVEEMDECATKCVGYIYIGKKLLDMGEVTRGEEMLGKAFSLIEGTNMRDLDDVLVEFHWIFFIRPTLTDPFAPITYRYEDKYQRRPIRYNSAFEK